MPSNFRNLMSKFFGVGAPRPTASTPPPVPPAPKTAEDYVRELDKILVDAQSKLEKFIDDLDLRIIKRNMQNISFVRPPEKIKSTVQKSKPIPGPSDPNLDLSKNPPAKKPNPIFESNHSAWRRKATELKDIMQSVVMDLQNFLVKVARAGGYNPPNTDLASLTRDISQKKFPNIDRPAALSIIKKLKIFQFGYKELVNWVNFFHKVEKDQQRAAKKKI